ncbi:MAG TPA: hypothetical protein VFB66_12030 [Tepidisphaeraceae bacterium]|nr:hypothetical protein [Tepidisphaeraceae bacterium]
MYSRLLIASLLLMGCAWLMFANVAVPRSIPTKSTTPERATDVPASAKALGLGQTVAPEQMVALERWAKGTGRFIGQECGMTVYYGRRHGSISNCYEVPIPGVQRPQFLSFDHIQHGDYRILSVDGPEFEYRLVDRVFVLRHDAAQR